MSKQKIDRLIDISGGPTPILWHSDNNVIFPVVCLVSWETVVVEIVMVDPV